MAHILPGFKRKAKSKRRYRSPGEALVKLTEKRQSLGAGGQQRSSCLQVVHFETGSSIPGAILKRCGCRSDIAAIDAAEVDTSFSARRSALGKNTLPVFNNRKPGTRRNHCYRFPSSDMAAVKECAAILTGRLQAFSAAGSSVKSTVRHLFP